MVVCVSMRTSPPGPPGTPPAPRHRPWHRRAGGSSAAPCRDTATPGPGGQRPAPPRGLPLRPQSSGRPGRTQPAGAGCCHTCCLPPWLLQVQQQQMHPAPPEPLLQLMDCWTSTLPPSHRDAGRRGWTRQAVHLCLLLRQHCRRLPRPCSSSRQGAWCRWSCWRQAWCWQLTVGGQPPRHWQLPRQHRQQLQPTTAVAGSAAWRRWQ
mmetsp:Transcript_22192/g.48456  ORF Transcript_22192/g.48456 Transcript_22192/m.48456 type:complete len:207 (+) Transcript_22192:586-1206(+)